MTRIHYVYLAGPLKGRAVPHAVLPKNPGEPILHRLTTCLKDTDADHAAQGIYHLEKGPGEDWVAVHHPGAQDKDWHVVEKPKEQAAQPRPARRPKKAIKIPDSHPLARRFKQFAEALKEARGQGG